MFSFNFRRTIRLIVAQHRQELAEQVASAEEAHDEEVRALKAVRFPFFFFRRSLKKICFK
jgi:hypothetical protein